MEQLTRKLLLLLVILNVNQLNGYSQDKETWRRRVNENGEELSQKYYYRLEDMMNKWMSDAGWEDKVVDIRFVTMVKDGSTSYFMKFDTQNCVEHFYARYDNIDWDFGEYLFVQTPYPKEFEDQIEELKNREANRAKSQIEEWEMVVDIVDSILRYKYLPRYKSLVKDKFINDPDVKAALDPFWKEFYKISSLRNVNIKKHGAYNVPDRPYIYFSRDFAEYGAKVKEEFLSQTWNLKMEENWDNVAKINLEGVGWIYYNRGESKKGGGDYEGAIRDYSTSIKFIDKEPLPYFSRGLVKSKIRDLSGALIDYLQVIELDEEKKYTNVYDFIEPEYKKIYNSYLYAKNESEKLNDKVNSYTSHLCIDIQSGEFSKICYKKRNENIYKSFRLLYIESDEMIQKIFLDTNNKFYNELGYNEDLIIDWDNNHAQLKEKMDYLNTFTIAFKKITSINEDIIKLIYKYEAIFESSDIKDINKSLLGVNNTNEIREIIELNN